MGHGLHHTAVQSKAWCSPRGHSKSISASVNLNPSPVSPLCSNRLGCPGARRRQRQSLGVTLISPRCGKSWRTDKVLVARRGALMVPGRKGMCAVGYPGVLIRSGSTTMRNSVVAMSIVGPEHSQTLFMIVTGCAAVGQVLEARTKWGGHISGPLLAMGTAAILSGTGVIPASSPIYDMVFSTLMPLGAALTLLETDAWSSFLDAGSTLKAFWFGALGTILGTILSFKVVGSSLGPDGWKVLGLTSAHLLAAGMAADNLAMGLYFGILMAIPCDSRNQTSARDSYMTVSDVLPEQKSLPTVESLAVSIAAAATACFVGDAIASLLPSSFAGSGLAIMAVLASSFNALASHHYSRAGQTNNPLFAGSQNLGGALMLLFFAVVGASTGLREAIAGGWPLPIFIIILITVHLTTILSLGWVSKLPMHSILIASNANIGGPATAAAMANARSWHGLVRPALVVGTLGYTIGTAIGCLVGVHFLRPMV